jgi:EF hand domain-containing protein
MCTMRHSPVALIMLLASTAVVAAQTPGQNRVVTPAIQMQAFAFDSASPGLAPRATPDDVVSRLMSFDRDHDGKVSPSELPERMQPLITSGDADFDGALDAKEVRTLALAPTVPVTARGFQSGGYGFADEVGVSSSSTRSHIEGVLDDLGLPRQTRDELGAIAYAFMDALEADAGANLMNDLERVLNTAQLVAFRSALDQPDQNRRFVVTTQAGGGRFVIQGRLEAQLEQFALKSDDKRYAQAALDQYKARLRLNEADRVALIEPMKDLLTGEQRDNLQAALARRPLVKNNVMGVVGGATFLGKVPRLETAQPIPAILIR